MATVPTELPIETRRKLLSTLMSTLSSVTTSTTLAQATPPSPLLLTTFSIIKLLGRSAAGSEELARESGLRILLTYGGLERVDAVTKLAVGHEDDTDEFDGAEDEPNNGSGLSRRNDPLLPYESEALRCLCNTLTLHPSSRIIFPILLAENNAWLTGLVALLTADKAGFLAARLLFLLTSTQSGAVAKLVEQGDVVRVMTDVGSIFRILPPTQEVALT